MNVIWDFAAETSAAGITPAASETGRAGGVRGSSEVGVRALTGSGIGIEVSGNYDGIGSDTYRAVTGRAAVNVPLN